MDDEKYLFLRIQAWGLDELITPSSFRDGKQLLTQLLEG